MLPRRTARITWYPRDWKGNIDSDVITQRVWEQLSLEERARVTLVSKANAVSLVGAFTNAGNCDHNTLDAGGIGLKRVGRFERVRVFA